MSEESSKPTVFSFDSALLECPICFKSYAEVDPTTFLCGHSCCIIDAKKLKVCCLCKGQIPLPEKHTVSIALRDVAQNLLQKKSPADPIPKGILKVSAPPWRPSTPITQFPTQQNTIEYLGSRAGGPTNSNAQLMIPRPVGPGSGFPPQVSAYAYTPPPPHHYQAHPGGRRHFNAHPHGLIPFPPGTHPSGLHMMSGMPPSPNMIVQPDGSMYLASPCPYMVTRPEPYDAPRPYPMVWSDSPDPRFPVYVPPGLMYGNNGYSQPIINHNMNPDMNSNVSNGYHNLVGRN